VSAAQPQLRQHPEPQPCPACGSSPVPGALFCHICGHALGAARPADTAERRVVTVLFGDLSDFTSWAEDLDPERVGGVTDRVLAALAQAVLDVGGHVDKLTGDGIMAVFGAPTAHEDDPERAVRAALAMQDAVGQLVAGETGGDRRLGLRVGVNTGEVLAGVQAALAYTVVGDTVNTASRLADAATVGAVFVGRETAVSTMGVASWRALPLLQLKGKRDLVAAYELVGLRPVNAPRLELGDEAAYLGREEELGQLISSFLQVASSRRPATVLVTGEAGVGKTRAAAELAGFVREIPGGRVLWGRVSRYGVGHDISPLLEIVRLACGIGDDADDAEITRRVRHTVQRLDPLSTALLPDAFADRLLEVLGLHPDDIPARSAPVQPSVAAFADLDTAGTATPGRRLASAPSDLLLGDSGVEAVAALLRALSEEGPLLVVIDDLQWASDELVSAIGAVARHVSGPVQLLLVDRDPTDVALLPAPLSLALAPLDEQSSEQLLRAYLGGALLQQDARDALLARARGNPYFLAELLHLLVDRGLLVRQDETWVVTGERLPSDVLPSGVQAVLAARIDGLPPTAKSVLRSAAVLGTRFPASVLTVLGAGDRSAVDEVLHELAERQLLRPSEGSDTMWSFQHPMARDVAYAGLPKAERARRHARAAAWGSAHLSGPRPEVDSFVAAQAGAALQLATDVDLPPGSPVWAIRPVGHSAAARLGEAAIRRDEPRTAAELLQRACDLGEGLPEEVLMPTRVALAGALAGLRRLDEAEVALRGALFSTDGALRRRARTILGDIRHKQGRDSEAVEALLGAFVEALDEDDLAAAAGAMRQLGLVDYYGGRLISAEDRFTQAAELARAVHDKRGEGWALQHLAWSATTRGDYRLADTSLSSAAGIFEALGDPGGLGWCTGTEALVRVLQGRLQESRSVARRLLPLAELAASWDVAISLTIDALAAAELGDLDNADAEAERAEKLFEAIGDDWGRSLALVALGASARAAGRLPEALEHFENAVRVAEDGAHPLTGTLALVGLGFTALDAGQLDRAETVAARARASLSWLELEPHAALAAAVLHAQVVRSRGEPERAVALLQQALSGGDAPTLLFPRRQAMAHLAGSLVECRQPEAALAVATTAAGVHAEDIRSRVLALRALGTARAACGELAGAREAYEEAVMIARSTAARGQLAITERLLAGLEARSQT